MTELPTPPWPDDGSLSRRTEFQDAVREVLLQAASRRLRRMTWVSSDWADWPVGEPAVVDALTTWVRSGPGQMIWLAQDFQAFHGRLARLMTWRRDWSHRLQCLTSTESTSDNWPSLLIADDAFLLQWSNSVHGRGRISTAAGDIRRAQEWVDAVLQRSTATLPVTTLGI